ncbi:GntR family transcriptional regulator [Caproicibacterium sp. NSD3]
MNSQKKYIQLYSHITDTIKSGGYISGDKLPTELELAETYGVSRQTVRQALEKLEKDGFISKVQGSGSYITDSAAIIKQTMRIAVITTYISTYIFPSILRGIENVATANHYSLMLSATNSSIAKEREILRNFSINSVDGIIIEGTKTAFPNPNLTFYKFLADKNIPLVFINGYYPELFEDKHDKIVCVVTEDYKGAYSQTLELIRKGHSLIGGIFKCDDIQGIRRYSGYIDALTKEEIGINDDCIIWFNTETKLSIEQQMARSKMLSECTAILCYNDEVAMQVLSYYEKTPGKLTALRSFDGTLSGQQHGIDFNSLVHPKEKLGQLAANKLLSIIDGKHEENTVMPWE